MLGQGRKGHAATVACESGAGEYHEFTHDPPYAPRLP